MADEFITIYLDEDANTVGRYRNDVSDEDLDQEVTFLRGPEDNFNSSYTIAGWGKGPVDADHFIMDLSGFKDDFTFHVKSMDSNDVFSISGWDTRVWDGTYWVYTYTGTDGDTHVFRLDPLSDNGTGTVTVNCFTRGAMIATEAGEKAIETLCAGDLVRCGDGELRAIQWIGGREVAAADLAVHPEWKPVTVRAGALGARQPARDIQLSPQHAVLLSDWRAELLFGATEVLVPVKHLVNDLTIGVDHTCKRVEYFHIMLEEHHTIFADGLECETLYPEALRANTLDGQARSEILSIFPELAGDITRYGPEYRMTLQRYEADALMNA